MAGKISTLRIFPDDKDKLNLSVQDARGGILAVPNFTLAGDARKGRRPDFTTAAPAAAAEPIFQAFVSALKSAGCDVATGSFGADMVIDSASDGPVNIIIEIPSSSR